MSITKKQALRAIAARARKNAGLDFDPTAMPRESEIREYLKSAQPSYRQFAEFFQAAGPKSGGHPDYDYLAHAESIGTTVEGNITTLFMDLKNFTKYCCFLSREKVYQAKYASIEATIGVCRIHGGHLHDITGDGVMFFFGGARANDFESAESALAAAADAMLLLEEEVIVEYNNKSQFPNIHPKIGVDFGPTLWGAYGAAPDFEVKATAFNVDIANKMMSKRNSQEVAIGDDLKNHLDILENEYLEPGWTYERQLTVDGLEKTISYRTWVFNWRKQLKERGDSDRDLARLGIVAAPLVVTGSRTTLGDAPLA
jgi:class 3 adenylate cyclase